MIEIEEQQLDASEVYKIRQEKLAAMRKEGFDFPNQFRQKDKAQDLINAWNEKDKETLESLQTRVAIAGRMVLRRIMGKASFFHIQDVSGRIQVYLRENDLPEIYHAFKHWDLGDIVGVEGFLFKTKTGELSVHAESVHILTKSLRPLPDKFHGLTDREERYRRRYVDLIANEESRKTFVIRSRIVQAFRNFMDKQGYLEVETPMMHPIPGGALARPFITHHNTYDRQMYLRIAPELYLKRLVVGGFERVYEINRNFRNEGVSTRHNPEFTMVEFYQAYADYQMMMNLTEQLMHELCDTVMGTRQISYQGHILDFSRPFARMSVVAAIMQYHPQIKVEELQDLAQCRQLVSNMGFAWKETDGLGKLHMIIFEETVEQLLIQPTFITAYPTEVSPLARRTDGNPEVTDRFEFFIAGREIGNGFSELNDAEDQAARFKKQVESKEAGDMEAMHFDQDYIEALEYGMPPTAGEGIGIDRLVMLFTDATSIRDVILFPHLR